jgi:WD40 repeat protein
VNAVAFSPDGKTLASGGEEGQVILWDRGGGQELMSLDDHGGGIYAVAFSPDGKVLAAGGSGTDGKSAEVTFWYGDGAPGPGPMKQSDFRR